MERGWDKGEERKLKDGDGKKEPSKIRRERESRKGPEGGNKGIIDKGASELTSGAIHERDSQKGKKVR